MCVCVRVCASASGFSAIPSGANYPALDFCAPNLTPALTGRAAVAFPELPLLCWRGHRKQSACSPARTGEHARASARQPDAVFGEVAEDEGARNCGRCDWRGPAWGDDVGEMRGSGFT